MKTALYRHFDSAGALLYVGISLDTIRRTQQHKHGARWFEQIARIDIEWLADRTAALAAEAAAILAENPAHNLTRPRAALHLVAKLAPPVRQAPAPSAVLHKRTGRRNGWYMRPGVGQHMLGWFRAVFPRDEFEFIEAQPGADNFIYRELELKSLDSALWAGSAPDYAAGDRLDEAAA